ncbi:MAG: cysteine desulfurase [Candidatus Moranbacteria bacterium]|nr:cysteine desulfurase [Candidatus Moranbacteria bacterium]
MNNYKKDFTILRNNPELTYLDSTASSLTPDSVVEKINEYYKNYRANIARGVYKTSEQATEEYEKTRQKVANFINAAEKEIVFTSGTTMSLNMIAYGLSNLVGENNNIVTTAMEHHANFIPWQQLAKNKEAEFRVTNIDKQGRLDLNDLKNKVDKNTKILTFTYVSNVLGTINPVKEIIQEVKKINPEIITVVDAAQASPHLKLDVKNLDCDFLAFSGHKMLGPTGVGVLYGKIEKLKLLKPIFTGGEMISEVTCQASTFAELPHRLEAGTPNIAGAIAFKESLKYLKKVGFENIQKHEQKLVKYTFEKMKNEFGDDVKIFGPEKVEEHSGSISFTFKKYHPHDIAAILDQEKNVCIRVGMHCAMPLHREFLNVHATARLSVYLYNDKNDIDKFIEGLKRIEEILG